MIQTAASSSEPEINSSGVAPAQSGSLLSATFIGLLLTQFLGATNDNILRWLVIGIGKEYVAPDRISLVLAIGSGCFVLPYILLTAPAGYLADRFSKRQVIVICKIAEIVIMVGAVLAILIGSAVLLFTVVAMMGAQAALFGPAKLGSIPEMLRTKKISAANGLLGLTTVIAVVVGSTVGNWLASPHVTGAYGREHWWISAVVMIGVAVAGWLTSLLIQPLKAANPSLTLPPPQQWIRQTWRDLQILAEDRAMLRVALGIMFFWSLGLMAQLNIDQFASEGGTTMQTQVSALLGALVVGVGVGSVLAGIWSGGKVELGILPLGAGGLALFSFLLYTVEGELVNPSNAVHGQLPARVRVFGDAGRELGVVRRAAGRVYAGSQQAGTSRCDSGREQFPDVQRHAGRVVRLLVVACADGRR